MATRRKAARKTAAKKRVAKKRPAAKRRVVKRSARKRVAKKRAAKRPARRVAKRASRKVAKKRVAKRPARKAASKRVVKAAKPVRKAAPKARAGKPAARPAPAAFAQQKAEATAKDLLLFEIERARVAVLAAIQGLGAGSAMQPVAEGKWSTHEMVLHLSVRDRVRLEEFDALLAGVPASWLSVAGTPSEAAMNEAHLAPLREVSWDDAVRLLMTTRAELLGRLQAVPAEPTDVWSLSHPFGDMMRRLAVHDRKHAEAIKNARIAG
jgi:hypothetical protein